MAPTPERTTTTAEDEPGTARSGTEQGRRLELVEEKLQAHTRAVQTGVVRIRKQVVTETRTIDVLVRREQVIVERISGAAPAEPPEHSAREPLPEAPATQVRELQPGETIRIPVIEEEVIVQTRPVVVEEVIVGKRVVQAIQSVAATLRREEARIETAGDIQVDREQHRHTVRVKQDRGPRGLA